jgi:hypothetical protein
MSTLEDLRSDLQKKDLASMAALPVDARQYFANEVWPFFESILDVLDEQQGTIDELIEQTEDYLHAETAKEIGKPIGIGFAIADELEKRLAPQDPLRGLVAEYRSSAATALATIRDIAIPDDGDGESDEDAEGEGDEDDGDEEGAQ